MTPAERECCPCCQRYGPLPMPKASDQEIAENVAAALRVLRENYTDEELSQMLADLKRRGLR